MTQKSRYITLTLINYIPVLLACLCFQAGAFVIWFLFIASQIMLVIFNSLFTDKISVLTFLSANLIVSTIIANLLSFYLYYWIISPSSETLLVGKLGMIVGVIFVLIISLVAILIKALIIKSQK